MKKITLLAFLLIVPAFLWSQTEQDKFDVIIKGGTVYDGTGGDPIEADVGIKDDRIVEIGKLDISQAVRVEMQMDWRSLLASSTCSPGRLCL